MKLSLSASAYQGEALRGIYQYGGSGRFLMGNQQGRSWRLYFSVHVMAATEMEVRLTIARQISAASEKES
jgi:hypothetical protein